MTAEDRARLAWVWNHVERGLFRPVSVADQRMWCTRFVGSLERLWLADMPVVNTAFPKAALTLPIPGFAVEYDLSNWAANPQRASLRITFEKTEVACHHIDHGYEDRMALQAPPGGSISTHYPTVASRSDDLLADIQWVLDRYVLHPCAHVHPSADVLSCLFTIDQTFRACLHEIRLGMGITNPFAALCQYRVNLMQRKTVAETIAAKEAERDRIALRMREALLTGGVTAVVPAGVLFPQVR